MVFFISYTFGDTWFVVSYSKDYQREAGILKIEFFSKKQNPSRRRYSRYEEAYLQSTKSQHYKLAAG